MGAKPEHDPAYQRLRKLLRQWREAADLRHRGLAELLNKPHSYVYKVESGNRRIDPIEFGRWAKACGVKQTDVLIAIGLRKAR